MLKKISIIFTIFILFKGVSYAAYDFSWTTYQVYASKYDSSSDTIINGILNNNLSSSYYIEKKIPTDGEEFERKEGDIMFFVSETGWFNHLDGFSITEYEGNSDYFTAIYNGKNFSSKICSLFRKGNIISVYINNGNIYTDIKSNDNTTTKKIKVGQAPSNMKVYTAKIKITKGYTNCTDANYLNNGSSTNPPVQYRMIYYTRYLKDDTGPSVSSYKLVDQNNNEITNADSWFNTGVKLKIYCKDNPPSSPNRNSGCYSNYLGTPNNKYLYSDPINNHLLPGDKISIILKDNVSNVKMNEVILSNGIGIDQEKPFISNNKIVLQGKNDITSGYNYVFSTENNNINTILADEYKLMFILKDTGIECDLNGLCKGISGIKSYNININGNSICSGTLTSYNPNKEKVEEYSKVISCNIDLKQDIDYDIKISFDDYAGNSVTKNVKLNSEPNKPINLIKNCNPINSKYSTNENNDAYECNVQLKDRWGNPTTKPITLIENKTSLYIDNDIYDGDNLDDTNAITILEKNNTQNQGKYYIKYKSIVPGTTKIKFNIKKYNSKYLDEIDNREYEITTPTFQIPITSKNITIYDMSGNIVTYTGMSANTTYNLKQCLNFSGFDETKDYSIGDFDKGLNIYPSDIYEIKNVSTQSISNPTNGCYNITFSYDIIGTVNKTLSLKFNPSITLRKDGKVGKFALGEDSFGANDNTRFKFSIIGFNSAYGDTNIIGQGKKQFNITSYEIKTKIRKNAYKYINSLKENNVTNNTIIKNGNYELDSSEYNSLKSNGVKTLIIKNGDLIISTNIDKRLDIAVVTDEINTDVSSSDYIEKGNIIIKPNVTFINGLLYADRSILAGKEDININNISLTKLVDINYRSKLTKQLLFYGTIIARNTVAGSIKGEDGKYTLPGGKTIEENNTNYNLASLYDIAFLRIGAEGYTNGNNAKYNNGKNDYVIIRYNPDIKLNPSVLLK